MPKSKALENLQELEQLTKNEESDDESDNENDTQLQAPIQSRIKSVGKVNTLVEKNKVYNVKPKDPEKEKKPRTEAQINAWNKALQTRQEKRDLRAKENQDLKDEIDSLRSQAINAVKEKANESKQKIENSMVKKAIAIKKKQIKAEAMLDEISDDDTPMEDIKKMVAIGKKKFPNKTQITHYREEIPLPPKIIFY